MSEQCYVRAIKQKHENERANERKRSRARLHAPRSLQLRKYLGEPPMEEINIMSGNIRPVSTNCVADMELKEAMGCKCRTREREEEESAKRERRKRKREW